MEPNVYDSGPAVLGTAPPLTPGDPSPSGEPPPPPPPPREPTQAPTDPPPSGGGASLRHRLTRSRSERMIAGVAGGIAEYFDVDPVLVRVGFGLLAVFGGSGIAAYLLAWILLPEQGSLRSLADDVLSRRRGRGRRQGAVIVAVVSVAALALSSRFWVFHHGLLWVGLLALAGVALLRSSDNRSPTRSDRPGPGATTAAPGDADWSSSSAAAPSDADAWRAQPVRPREPRPASPTPYLLGVLAILGGLAAGVDFLGWLSISATGFLAAALAASGVALIIGAVRGRVGGAVLVALGLAAALGVAAAIPGSAADGLGQRTWHPVDPTELRAYRLGVGDATLDLRDLPSTGQPQLVRATVGVGHLVVIVPSAQRVRTRDRLSAGETLVFGDRQGGVSVDRTTSDPHTGALDLDLDLRVGFGQVEVERAT